MRWSGQFQGKCSQQQVSGFDSILALLPQTQCTRCGYPDCAAYAQAIDTGLAPINQCPPGGAEGIAVLAALTAVLLLRSIQTMALKAP